MSAIRLICSEKSPWSIGLAMYPSNIPADMMRLSRHCLVSAIKLSRPTDGISFSLRTVATSANIQARNACSCVGLALASIWRIGCSSGI